MDTKLKNGCLVIQGTNRNIRYDFSHSALCFFRDKGYPIPPEATAIEQPKLEPHAPVDVTGYPFKTPSWPNQLAGMQHVLEWKRYALIHAMGCGKSKTILDVIGYLIWKEIIKHSLIVCPLSVFTVWPVQHQRHAAFGKLIILKDTKKAKAILAGLENSPEPCIVVVNYEKLQALKDDLLRVRFGAVVADEAHKVKNPRAKRTQCLASIADQAEYSVIMTGTPVGRNLVDVFGEYRVMDPFWFGKSYWFFRQRYCQMGGWMNHSIVGYKNEAELRRIIDTPRHIVLKRDALPGLPPQIFQERLVEMDAEQKRIYKATKRKYLVELQQGVIDIKNAASRLTKLQEIANGFVILEDHTTHRFSDSKLLEIIECLEDVDPSDRVTIWCRFREDIRRMEELIPEKLPDRTVMGFHGDTKDRDVVLDSFRNTPGAVLAIQTQTGGEGIDLTCSATAFRYSRLFSFLPEEQATARLHRPGQERPVTYVDFIMNDTVDQKIQATLQNRQDLSSWLIENKGNLMDIFNDL